MRFNRFWEGQKLEEKVVTNDSINVWDLKNYQIQCIPSHSEETTWIDIAEKGVIDSYKQQIEEILSSNYKKEMKMRKDSIEMIIDRLNLLDRGYYFVNKNINIGEQGVCAVYTVYKNYKKYFSIKYEGLDLNEVLDAIENRLLKAFQEYEDFFSPSIEDTERVSLDKHLDYLNMGMKLEPEKSSREVEDVINTIQGIISTINKFQLEEGREITPEINDQIKKELNSIEDEKYKAVYDTKDIGNEIDFTGAELVDIEKDPTVIVQGELGGDETLEEDYVKLPEDYINSNSPFLSDWVSDNTMSITAEDSKSDQELLIEKIVTDIMTKLFLEGSCTLEINLKENNDFGM